LDAHNCICIPQINCKKIIAIGHPPQNKSSEFLIKKINLKKNLKLKKTILNI
jgi:hypothetical protein